MFGHARLSPHAKKKTKNIETALVLFLHFPSQIPSPNPFIKATGNPIKWSICFSTVLSKVFFDRKATVSSLNNANSIGALQT